MRNRRPWLLGGLAVALAALGFALQPQPSFDERFEELLPQPHEQAFLKTAWHHDLLEARAEAERTGKPLFMWLMDGNPLGLL